MGVANKHPLSPKQAAFLEHYLQTNDAADAYIQAYQRPTMERVKAQARGHQLLTQTRVGDHVEAARTKAVDAVGFKVEDVLRNWVLLVQADPNKLSQHRRLNCRHCFGIDHHYQWADRELAEAQAQVIDYNGNRLKGVKERPMPDSRGGTGWLHNRQPYKGCPDCAGEGVSDVHLLDTRFLGPAERLLYAGTKRTKEGIKIKMRDQDGALDRLARYLGMLRPDTPVGGPNINTNGGPGVVNYAIPNDPQTAAAVYQQFIKKT